MPPWFLHHNNMQFWATCKSLTHIYSGRSWLNSFAMYSTTLLINRDRLAQNRCQLTFLDAFVFLPWLSMMPNFSDQWLYSCSCFFLVILQSIMRHEYYFVIWFYLYTPSILLWQWKKKVQQWYLNQIKSSEGLVQILTIDFKHWISIHGGWMIQIILPTK
jgi:hypothetical protein